MRSTPQHVDARVVWKGGSVRGHHRRARANPHRPKKRIVRARERHHARALEVHVAAADEVGAQNEVAGILEPQRSRARQGDITVADQALQRGRAGEPDGDAGGPREVAFDDEIACEVDPFDESRQWRRGDNHKAANDRDLVRSGPAIGVEDRLAQRAGTGVAAVGDVEDHGGPQRLAGPGATGGRRPSLVNSTIICATGMRESCRRIRGAIYSSRREQERNLGNGLHFVWGGVSIRRKS